MTRRASAEINSYELCGPSKVHTFGVGAFASSGRVCVWYMVEVRESRKRWMACILYSGQVGTKETKPRVGLSWGRGEDDWKQQLRRARAPPGL